MKNKELKYNIGFKDGANGLTSQVYKYKKSHDKKCYTNGFTAGQLAKKQSKTKRFYH